MSTLPGKGQAWRALGGGGPYAGTMVADRELGAGLPHNFPSLPPLWGSIFPAKHPSGVTGARGGQWCQTEPQVANQLIRFVLNGQNPSSC